MIWKIVVREVGFEPTTYGLRVHCATFTPFTHFKKGLSRGFLHFCERFYFTYNLLCAGERLFSSPLDNYSIAH